MSVYGPVSASVPLCASLNNHVCEEELFIQHLYDNFPNIPSLIGQINRDMKIYLQLIFSQM